MILSMRKMDWSADPDAVVEEVFSYECHRSYLTALCLLIFSKRYFSLVT